MMKELLLASWDQAPWVAIVVFFVLGTSFAIPKCLKIILFFVLCLKMIDNGADEIDFFGGKISKSKSRAKDDIKAESENTATSMKDGITGGEVIEISPQNFSGKFRKK